MKILLICHEYPPLGGGGGRQFMNLAQAYAKQHEVYFLTVGFHEFGICQKDGYTLHRLRALRKRVDKPSNLEFLSFVFESWRNLARIMREFAPDVVHLFFAIPEGVLLFHPQLRKIPAVISVRGADVPGHDPDRFTILYKLVRPLVRLIWKKAGQVVCNSHDLKNEVLRIAPDLNVRVIPNGVDSQRFKAAQKAKSPSELVLLYVGRIIPLKRLDLVIRSVAELRKLVQTRKIIFRIVGRGEQQRALEKLVHDLDLADQVIFVGDVVYERIHEEYHKADVYIQVSTVEGMSNAILEAMSSGLPVITTNVGGASELLNQNGFIFEQASVEVVVACVQKYLEEPSLLEVHGKQSRLLAEKFGFERVSQEYLGTLFSYLPNRGI